MYKNRILFFFAAIIPFFASAQNGYWEQRQVCDYEQSQIQTPKTRCVYAGNLMADDLFNPVTIIDKYAYFSKTQVLDNHLNCPSSYYENTSRYLKLQNGTWAFVSYRGHLPLSSQTHYMETSTQTVLIPGSCRTEWVWIPLCDGCQIP